MSRDNQTKFGWLLLPMTFVIGCGGSADKPNETKSSVKSTPDVKPFVPENDPPPEKSAPKSATSIIPKAPDAVLADPAGKENKKSNPPAESKSEKPKSAPEKPTSSAPTGAGKIDLRQNDVGEMLAFIQSQKGKYVVADAWATWCVPCREHFPEFVSLAKQRKSDDVTFLAFANDEEDPTKVLNFLRSQNVDFVSFLLTNEMSKTQEKLDFEAIPHYFLFDKEGKIIKRAEKLDAIAKKLDELLKKT